MAYPSTFLDLYTAVLAKGRMDATADTAKAKDYLNQTYANVCLETEALATFAVMTTTASVVSYTISPAAVRIKGMYETGGGISFRPLEPISLERMLELRQGAPASSGPLRFYCLIGLSQFELYPTPDGTEEITIYYVKQPTVLTSDGDVPEIPEPFASKLLEYGALVEAADFKREDPAVQQNYQQQYEKWLQRFRAHLNRKRGGVPEQMLVYGSPGSPPHDRSADFGW